MGTVSPSWARRAMSSSATVVLPVPVSPLTRTIKPRRARTSSSSGGKYEVTPWLRPFSPIQNSPNYRALCARHYFTRLRSDVFTCIHHPDPAWLEGSRSEHRFGPNSTGTWGGAHNGTACNHGESLTVIKVAGMVPRGWPAG